MSHAIPDARSTQRSTLKLVKSKPITATAPVNNTERPLESRQLLQGGKAVAIAHNGALYRLQATRQGKLILTK